MNKYYTRACNFYYGKTSKKILKEKSSIPLNGNNLISFDKIEILTRKGSKLVDIKYINKLPNNLKLIFNLEPITLKIVFLWLEPTTYFY